jgi:hypothetical protein
MHTCHASCCIDSRSVSHRLWCTSYVSVLRQHTSAYVSIRAASIAAAYPTGSDALHTSAPSQQHTSAYVSIRQHTSAYVSIRQHTSAYVSAYAAHTPDTHPQPNRPRSTPPEAPLLSTPPRARLQLRAAANSLLLSSRCSAAEYTAATSGGAAACGGGLVSAMPCFSSAI